MLTWTSWIGAREISVSGWSVTQLQDEVMIMETRIRTERSGSIFNLKLIIAMYYNARLNV